MPTQDTTEYSFRIKDGLLGGPPNTTYSEVTGAVTLIKVYNPGLMTWAALLAIAFAFVGKLGAFLQSIPTPVMGGIIILLFGAMSFSAGELTLEGIALAGVLGVVLNLVLPQERGDGHHATDNE